MGPVRTVCFLLLGDPAVVRPIRTVRFLFGLHIISTRTPTNPRHTHGPGFYRRAATDSDGVGATGKQERTSFFGEVTHVLNNEQRRDLRTGKYIAGICTVGEQNETGGGSLFTAPLAGGGHNITVTHIPVREQEKSYQSLHHRVHVPNHCSSM